MTITEKDLDDIETRLKETFTTKDELLDFKHKALGKLDKILKEVTTSRQEETLLSHKVTKLEQELNTLKVPQAQQ